MTSALFQGSKHAQLYSKFRPYPPQNLIENIINYVKRHTKLDLPFVKAVDVGCGNGQSTTVLSPYFKSVLGLDISDSQIKCAQELNSKSNIEYRVSKSEELPVSDLSTQLVTFSQSLHWFNPPNNIYKEVDRILMRNGVIAAYGYWIPFPVVADENQNLKIHGLIYDYLHEEVLGKYWDEERYTVQNQYVDINLPFKGQESMKFTKKSESSLSDYIGYLSTWSAYQKFLKIEFEESKSLLQEIENRMKIILKTTESSDKIIFALHTEYFMVMAHK